MPMCWNGVQSRVLILFRKVSQVALDAMGYKHSLSGLIVLIHIRISFQGRIRVEEPFNAGPDER